MIAFRQEALLNKNHCSLMCLATLWIVAMSGFPLQRSLLKHTPRLLQVMMSELDAVKGAKVLE